MKTTTNPKKLTTLNSEYNPNTRSAVIYSRISCNSDSLENLSLTAQTEKSRAYANLNDLNVVGEFTEVFSAKSADNRPELQKALKLAKKNKAVLIVYSLSRFARSTTDALLLSDELNNSGCDLVLLMEKIETNTSSGRLFFSICASFCEYERQLISERTANALSVKRNANKRISGHIPFGYTLSENEVDLIPKKSEQKTIVRIKNLRAEGFSFAKVSEILNAEKVLTKTGKKFAPNTIRQIVVRQAKLAA